MDRFDPAAALVTTASAGGPFVRIARWLASGFEAVGANLDVVWLEGPPGVEVAGRVRHVRLGTRRASRSVGALRSYFRRESPPVALATPGYVAPFAVAASHGTPVEVVPWEAGFAGRELGDLPLRMRVLPWLQRTAYRRARRVAAVSSKVAEALGEGAIVLPNPVDAAEIRRLAAASPAPAPATEGFVVFGAGRLAAYKGYDVLLDALALAAPSLGDWTFRLAGDGPERTALEERVRRLGLSDRVELMGFVENPYPVLASSAVFAQPSISEGFGIGIAEALALGVPVVATTSGGPEEVLDGGRYGLLVPPGDVGALATALTRLADDDGLRRRLAESSEAAVQRYAPATVAAAILRLTEETVRR